MQSRDYDRRRTDKGAYNVQFMRDTQKSIIQCGTTVITVLVSLLILTTFGEEYTDLGVKFHTAATIAAVYLFTFLPWSFKGNPLERTSQFQTRRWYHLN